MINVLRPRFGHEHPEWIASHLIRAGSPDETIDRHRFGYHISTVNVTILQRNMGLVLLIENRAPLFPMGMFLPLIAAQCANVADYDAVDSKCGELCVYQLPESTMQRELVKLMERAQRHTKPVMHRSRPRRTGSAAYSSEGVQGLSPAFRKRGYRHSCGN